MAGTARLTWLGIAASNGAIVTVGLFGATRGIFGLDPDNVFLAWSVAAIALVTFFGTLSLGRHASFPSDRRIRGAIVITVIVVYLMLVAIVAFFQGDLQQPTITRDFVSSLTTTVAVIATAYIGSSAFVDARRNGKGADDARDPDA